jgi:hypothetical protein
MDQFCRIIQSPVPHPCGWTFWASRILNTEKFQQNNFHARKILRKFFQNPEKSGQKISKPKKIRLKNFRARKFSGLTNHKGN